MYDSRLVKSFPPGSDTTPPEAVNWALLGHCKPITEGVTCVESVKRP